MSTQHAIIINGIGLMEKLGSVIQQTMTLPLSQVVREDMHQFIYFIIDNVDYLRRSAEVDSQLRKQRSRNQYPAALIVANITL